MTADAPRTASAWSCGCRAAVVRHDLRAGPCLKRQERWPGRAVHLSRHLTEEAGRRSGDVSLRSRKGSTFSGKTLNRNGGPVGNG
jgi:hypothetical protein